MKKQARSKQPEIKKAGVSKPVALNGTVRLDIKGDPKTEHEELQSMTKNAIKPTVRNAITAWEWARQH